MLSEAIRLKREMGDQLGVAISEHETARLREMQGLLQEASRLYRKSIATLTTQGAAKDAANAKWRYSQLLRRQPDGLQDAYRLNKEAVEAYGRQGRWVKRDLASIDLGTLETLLHKSMADSFSTPDDGSLKPDQELLDQNIHSDEITIAERLAQIRERSVDDPIAGADELSSLIAQHPELRPYQADLDIIRSELRRLKKEMESLGRGDFEAMWNRNFRNLAKMLTRMENGETQAND
jgi:hypothetical protein